MSRFVGTIRMFVANGFAVQNSKYRIYEPQPSVGLWVVPTFRVCVTTHHCHSILLTAWNLLLHHSPHSDEPASYWDSRPLARSRLTSSIPPLPNIPRARLPYPRRMRGRNSVAVPCACRSCAASRMRGLSSPRALPIWSRATEQAPSSPSPPYPCPRRCGARSGQGSERNESRAHAKHRELGS